jgi:hypothetical protein
MLLHLFDVIALGSPDEVTQHPPTAPSIGNPLLPNIHEVHQQLTYEGSIIVIYPVKPTYFPLTSP